MLTATKPTKIDPIFAAIEAHRRATGARYIILEAIGGSAPERGVTEDAHDKAAEVDRAATKQLRKIRPTTVAGVMAVTAYFVEHIDRYPGWGWTTEPKNRDDPNWFTEGLIRNLAAAMATIGATA
jgi:hypothetical protein